jgi:hypothetical protein
MGDVLLLSVTKASQVILEFLDKDGKIQMNALNQVLGDSYVIQPWYSKGQKALELKLSTPYF